MHILLNKNILGAAVAPAATANRKGYSLGIKSGTVLEGLAQRAYPLPYVEGDLKVAVESIAAEINEPGMTGESLYERGIKEIVPMVAQKLNDHLSFCRNVIQPQIVELSKRVADRITGTDVGTLLRFKVVADQMPSIAADSSLSESIGQWAAESYSDAPLSSNVTMGDYTEEELLQFMSTGNSRVDGKMTDILVKNPGILSTIYKGLFQRQNYNSVQQLFEAIKLKGMSDEESAAYVAVFAYLLSQYFIQHIDTKAQAGFQEYLDFLTTIRGQAALKIKVIAEGYQRTVRMDKLITRVDGKTVFVNDTVYKAYLEQGGSVDAVLANTLRDTPYTTKAEIIANQEALLKAWRNYAMLVGNTDSLVAINHARQVYLEEYKAMLQEEFASVGELPESVSIDGILDKARAVLNVLPGKYLTEDTQGVAMVIICRSRYAEIGAEFTLASIQEATEKHPGIEPKEAALLAAIAYVCDWIVDQFQIIKNPG